MGFLLPTMDQAKLDLQALARLGRRGRLQRQPLDAQSARLAVGLEIDSRDEVLAEQERQDVIAVRPLLGRHVDLDAVAEAEQPLGAAALPDQRVERRKESLRRNPARTTRVAVQIGWLRHAGDGGRNQEAVFYERRDGGAGVLRRQAEIVAQLGGGGDAQRGGGAGDEGAMRVSFRRRRQGKDGGGDDTLGDVINALEAAAPRPGGDAAGPEQPFERALGVAPFPPAAAASAVLEVRGGHRAFGFDSPEDRVRLGALFAGEGAQRAPAGRAALGAGHPPAQQRVEVERQQRCLVRPIFEQPSLGLASPRGGVEQGAVVRPEAREGGQVMRPRQHVDTVDLVQGQALDGAAQVGLARDGRARRREALRRQRDATRGGERQAFDSGQRLLLVPSAN